MSLKAEYEIITEIPEAVREFYVQDDNGKHRLHVDGLVPKQKVDEFRTNNLNLVKERDNLKVEIDTLRKDFHEYTPDQIVEMKNQLESIKDKKILDDDGIEALVDKRTLSVRTEYEGQNKNLKKLLDTAQAEADKHSSNYRRLVIDRAVTDAATKSGILPNALVDIQLRGQMLWSLNDQGRAIAKDSSGEVIYGKDGTSPMTPTEWIETLKVEAPHFFANSNGGGAAGNGGSGGSKIAKITYKSDLKSAGEKAQYIKEHGVAAFSKLPPNKPE